MTITSKYPSKCKACGFAIAIGAEIHWTRETGAYHVSADDCFAAERLAKDAPAAPVVDLAPVAAFLAGARDRGLKWPKVRFIAPGGRLHDTAEMKLSLAGNDSKNPGAVYVKIDSEYFGLVTKTGDVRGQLAGRPDLIAALATIAAAPAVAAKAYGELMSRCSFCSLPLTDQGSIDAGYGPICAERYGLPHKAKGSAYAHVVTYDAGSGLYETVPVSTPAETLSIMDFAQAIDSAPKVADAPFSLTPQASRQVRGHQNPLF